MDRYIFSITGWGFFLFLYFYGTQRLYHNEFCRSICTAILICAISVMYYYRLIYPYKKYYLVMLLIVYFVLLLLLVKWQYRKINNWLLKRKWVKQVYADKDFTFVISSNAGRVIWDTKRANEPSWFDHLLSALLLLIPMLFLLLTRKLIF